MLGNVQRNGDPIPPVNSPRVPIETSVPVQNTNVTDCIDSVLTSPSPPSVPLRKGKKGLQPTQQPSSSRASVVFPILGAGNPFVRRTQDETIGYGTLREDPFNGNNNNTSQNQNIGSDPSVCTHSSPELPSSPIKGGKSSSSRF